MKNKSLELSNSKYIEEIKGHISNIQQEIYTIHSLLSQYRNFLLNQLEKKVISKRVYNSYFIDIKFIENVIISISSYLIKIIERLKYE